jgi:hypothetical protein
MSLPDDQGQQVGYVDRFVSDPFTLQSRRSGAFSSVPVDLDLSDINYP